ncbi:hypothetical protein KsCSTR_00450 [Candidatus Kuenenia stuttgartiensis]|uniref:Uncharacterized protein n=1 Tax=Kuenenia stuttgartiensis TaxID=174633 RepID=Q1PV88_KUEST|nr:hypothetical protein KsCSTR_00450 [Candidatus Kuenenia stuttgartiensis]CAJ71141.1 unknown protein [Candidatus Kuenenia stuttgartiensis]
MARTSSACPWSCANGATSNFHTDKRSLSVPPKTKLQHIFKKLNCYECFELNNHMAMVKIKNANDFDRDFCAYV